MSIIPAVLLAVTVLAPLKPVTAVDLSSHGKLASDVAWLNDDEVLVALIDGGVARVSTSTKKSSLWIPKGPLPKGSPYPELVATDGNVVVIMGAGMRNYMFRNRDGRYLYGFMQGRLNPRGVAVAGGRAVYMGWMGQAGNDDTARRGVLWTQKPGEPMNETAPIHRILGNEDVVKNWRMSAPPYAGSMVALKDGSLAVMTVAEPAIYRYDRNGRLIEVLSSGLDALELDSVRLVNQYRLDVEGRYAYLNRMPLIEDLVAMPDNSVAVLVRTASKNAIGWELWPVDRSGVARRIPLAAKANGPYGHMRCESRATRLACVTNLPDASQAKKPETAGANPRLLLFTLPK